MLRENTICIYVSYLICVAGISKICAFKVSLLDGNRFAQVGFVCVVLCVVSSCNFLQAVGSSQAIRFELWDGINASPKITEEHEKFCLLIIDNHITMNDTHTFIVS